MVDQTLALAAVTLLAAAVNGALGYGFSSMTVPIALLFGLYTTASFALLPAIVPSVIVGVPLGAWLIRRVHAETFRRVCMSFDAWVVGFGVSTLLRDLGLAAPGPAFLVLVAVMPIDLCLLYRFFFRVERRLEEVLT